MLLDVLKKEGFENEISLPELKKWIAKVIGGNRETIKRYLEYLQTFGMVYPTVKPNILRVNHDYEKHEKELLKTVVKAGRLSEYLDEGGVQS
jgi:predicted AAA+ superfamily ATPase